MTTDVTGLKDLVLQNSLQRVENGKTFPIFTQLPFNGAPFYIGSKEVFSKKTTVQKIQITPANVPGANHTVTYWDGLEWKDFEKKLGEDRDKALPRRTDVKNDDLSGSAQDGFFKVVLAKANTTIQDASTDGLNFQADTVSINYKSPLDFADLIPGVDQFFHLYPFGILETYPTKNNGERRQMESLRFMWNQKNVNLPLRPTYFRNNYYTYAWCTD